MSRVSNVNSANIFQIFATVSWEPICRLRPPFSRKPFCQSSANSWKKFTLTWSTPITKQNYAEGRTYTVTIIQSLILAFIKDGAHLGLQNIRKRFKTWSEYLRRIVQVDKYVYIFPDISLEDDVTVILLLGVSFMAWNINCIYGRYVRVQLQRHKQTKRETGRQTQSRGVQTDTDSETERRTERYREK